MTELGDVIKIPVNDFVTGKAQMSGADDAPRVGTRVLLVRQRDGAKRGALVRAVARVPNNPRGHHYEIDYEIPRTQS